MSKMSYKNKSITLIAGFVVVMVVCYNLAIEKTISQKMTYNNLLQEELRIKDASKKLLLLNQESRYYDSILSIYKIDGTSIQNNLLKVINVYAKDSVLRIVDFHEPHTFLYNNGSVNTYEFAIEGDYGKTINLIYRLEQQTKFGEIINLNLEKLKNYKTGKFSLNTRVLLQVSE